MSDPYPDALDEPRAPAPAPWRRLAMPAGLVAVGVAVIAGVSLVEGQSEPLWQGAVLVPDAPLPDNGVGEVYPAAFRRLTEQSLPESMPLLAELRLTSQGEDVLTMLGLDQHERVVCTDVPRQVLEPLLVSGRWPVPGAREVVAGDLARFESFTLDGAAFHTVGRLRRCVAGLAFAYLLPEHETGAPLFSEAAGATRGWIAPEGWPLGSGEDEGADGEPTVEVVGGITRTTTGRALAAIVGLVLIAAGGSLAQIRLLRHLGRRRRGPLAAVIDELSQHAVLLWGVHVLLYGLFFAGMLAALGHPVANLRLTAFVGDQFLEGDLSYIGDAYTSGNVLRASAATFTHNYLVATLALTIAPSLVLPFAGLLKNAPTFGFIGFVMSPMWTGAANELVYHSITMTLELEAYIVACFVIALWPIRLVRGLIRDDLRAEAMRGLRVVAEGALLAGLMLAIAAVYEATTVILFQ